jgi:predicted CoA-binding protein
MKKRTVVIGASENPERYAFKATKSLIQHGHPVFPVGLKRGTIENIQILLREEIPEDIDTVSLYVGPAHQEAWKDYVFNLKPKRIILNPGTEGGIIEKEAIQKGIECLPACTLVMLSTGQY